MFSTFSIRASLCFVALSLAAVSAPGMAQPAPGTLLGSTGNSTNELITINPSTGVGTFLADIGSQGPVTEIEFRADGVLFGSTGGGSSSIITIDPATGTETLVGTHAFGSVNGMEFVGGTLYGAYFQAGQGGQGVPPQAYSLVTINQSNGSLNQIAPLDYGPIRGLAYDSGSGVLYGVGQPMIINGNGPIGDVLFTINPSTGATSEVGPLGASVGAIEFGPNGTLYGGQAGGGGQPDEAPQGVGANLFAINTSTGAATPLGSTGFPALSGLSFVPAGVPEPTSVPAIGTGGIALLILLLAGLGLMIIRRG